MVRNSADIAAFIKTHAREIQDFGVSRIGLFGSFAKGTPTDNSDIDFLVEFAADRKTYRNFFGLATFLEHHLGRTVELITPQSLNRHSRDKILDQVQYVGFA